VRRVTAQSDNPVNYADHLAINGGLLGFATAGFWRPWGDIAAETNKLARPHEVQRARQILRKRSTRMLAQSAYGHQTADDDAGGDLPARAASSVEIPGRG
jgi:hypothetical protein